MTAFRDRVEKSPRERERKRTHRALVGEPPDSEGRNRPPHQHLWWQLGSDDLGFY